MQVYVLEWLKMLRNSSSSILDDPTLDLQNTTELDFFPCQPSSEVVFQDVKFIEAKALKPTCLLGLRGSLGQQLSKTP
jgi:hypothetical protein